MLQPSHIIRISDKAAYGSYNTEFRKRLQPSHIIRISLIISDKAAYGSYNTEFSKGCTARNVLDTVKKSLWPARSLIQS